MRRVTVLLGLIAAAAASAAAPLRGQADAPRLAVVLVVDQMRADYLTVLQRHWRSGVRTLLTEGAVFERAAYPYLHTVTCAGHATVSTGAFPRTHGMIGNEWWDREHNLLVDCTISDDPAVAHLSYGTAARSGNSPQLLRAQTIGDRLRARHPGARVVSLSLKPDAAITLAGHGGDIVTWFDQVAGAFVTSTAFTAARHPVLAAFLARDGFQRDLGEMWTLANPVAAYLFADATLGQRPPAGRNGLFPHEIRGPKGPDVNSIPLWRQSPFSDRYLARMAAAMVEGLELGGDDTPDVLAISFSALDLVGHAFGPETREVEDVLINLDRTVGELIAALDRRVGRGRYVLALTADHGVAPIPAPGSGGRIIREDVRERVEEILVSHWGPRPAGAYVPSVYSNYVYFAPGVFERLRREHALLTDVYARLNDIPGIARVIPSDELSVSSTDPVIRAAALSYMPARGGDLVLIPERNWITLARNAANATTHGGHHDYDQRVPLILFGAGIRAGHLTQAATPADIAPTLATLIGVQMPQAEGRVLREALK